MKVISLGWGIQSFTIAAMAALGEIERVDAAIHADTTHEASGTYAFAAQWTPWLEARGVRVVTVIASGKRLRPSDAYNTIVIPAYTKDTESGVHGVLRRQCTGEWKIGPIRRWLQPNRHGAHVDMLLGISLDEALRMRNSDVQYITHYWPLIDKRMTRADCRNWLTRNGLDIPPKSACIFCPYHNAQAWREMKHANGPDWQKAVEADEAIRKARPPYDVFVHQQCIPLVDVDLSVPQDHGQLELWQETCETGFCWS